MRNFLIAAAGAAFAFGAADASLAAGAVPGALASSQDSAISAEQRARLAERLRIVEQTMRVVDADLRKQDNVAARRQWIVESLYSMPLEKLRALGNPPTSAALSDAITRVKKVQQKALGSTTVDLVYQPFVPCRFADTRIVGGKISPSRSFDISQNGDVYGGSAACNITTLAGVPDNAIGAVAMNVTLFDTSTAASPGFVGVRPVGSANVTSILNWTASNPIAQDANTTIVAMDQSGATDEFEVFDSGPVHVIIDIMGVFTAPGATALDCTTVVTNGAGTVPTGSTFPFPIPTTCPAGYTGVAIACEYGPVPPAGLALTSVGAADVTTGFLTCLWRNESGGTPLQGSDFHTHTRCCRVPGR